MKSIVYSELVSMARTGDLLLFHGLAWDDQIIELLEGGNWSHVGMVVKAKDLGLNLPEDQLLLWESMPYADFDDVELNKKKVGPQLVDLYSRLEDVVARKTNDVVAYRKLTREQNEDFINSLREYIVSNAHEALFPSDLKLLYEFLLGKLLHIGTPLNEYFCSELIAETYIKTNIISTKYPPNRYDPKDFSSQGKLPLLNGSALDDEILLELTTIG